MKLCHLKDNSKTSTRAVRQNASVVRTLSDLFVFFFFYSGPQCCVVLLQRSAKLSRKTNKDNTFVTNAVRCCQKLMVHLMVRFASRIWLQSLSMGQISYPAWYKKGREMYKFWCCRTISQCGKPRVNA